MAEVHVSRVEIEKATREIIAKIAKDDEPQTRTKAFAIEVMNYWKNVAWPQAVGSVYSPPNHPWSRGGPGSYEESFEVKRNRVGGTGPDAGRFAAGYQVRNTSPNANFIEFGTGVDKPGSRSPWGPNTPTPEYGPARATAHHFEGTAP
jgi:hypothetical protein